jgi:hypothetical protein
MELFAWLGTHSALLSTLGAVAVFIWGVIQFVLQRQHEFRERQFETYHRLVKELVSPDSDSGTMWIDRQAAVIFELRNFHRYHEFTERMLEGLKEKWEKDAAFQWPRLLKEVELTLSYIGKKT